MDPTGWGLVAFVVLLSGALAYYGDVLGRKLGKKRLTFGRLRPRHTAAIMTALFGMLGSAIAIAALVMLSSDVRDLLFKRNELRADNIRLDREVKSKNADLENKQSELEQRTKDVKSTTDKFNEQRTKLVTAQAEVASLKSTARDLKRQAQLIRKEVQVLKGQLAAIKPELERIKKEKKSAEYARDYANGELGLINKKNLELMNEIKDNETKIRGLNVEIENLNKDSKALQEKYDATAIQTRKDIEELRQSVEDARSNLALANAELTKVQDTANQIIKGTVAVSRFQPMTFSRDEELARIPVRSNLNQAEARSVVFALMDQASSTAKAGGASVLQGSASYAFLPPGLDNNKHPISEEDQLQSLMQRIINVNREQVLIASTFSNAFKGEAVPLSIRILPNPTVYKKGQIIAETIIDGALTQDQIVDAITKFAQEQLAPKAVKDGMIPAIGQAHPLGEISQQDLLNLVAEIKSHQFRSRVKVVAADDLRAGDTLKLEFRVS